MQSGCQSGIVQTRARLIGCCCLLLSQPSRNIRTLLMLPIKYSNFCTLSNERLDYSQSNPTCAACGQGRSTCLCIQRLIRHLKCRADTQLTSDYCNSPRVPHRHASEASKAMCRIEASLEVSLSSGSLRPDL